MALGMFSDVNLADTAALSAGTWSGALPLANVQAWRPLTKPARQPTPATLANAKLEADLPVARTVTLVGVLFHTLSLAAKVRLTLAGADGVLATPAYSSGWVDVYPRMFASTQLPWEHPNWWTGVPEDDDLDLYPRHLWLPIPAPPPLCGGLRLEFDDATNAAGYFDLGALWIAAGWSPLMNFDRGREVGVEDRSLRDEGPSGRAFDELRTSRRLVTATWSNLEDAEAWSLFDAGARRGTTGRVLFVPNIDDRLSLQREAWPATFEQPPKPKIIRPGMNVVAAAFREIIA